MLRTIDLRSLNHPEMLLQTGTSEAMSNSLYNNMALAVRLLAEGADPKVTYEIESTVLQRVLNRFIVQNPMFNDPNNIQATDHGTAWVVNYNHLNYGFMHSGGSCYAQGEFAVDSKILLDLHKKTLSPQNAKTFPVIDNNVLVDGCIHFPRGNVHDGTFEYVRQLQNIFLMNGTIEFSTGEVQTGRREYIPALKMVRLVEGSITRPDATVETGCWTYNESTKQMDFRGQISQGTPQV